VLARRPARVLEIGCGTGLVALRVAPHSSRYLATDFSTVALARLEAALARAGLAHVELACRAADDFEGIEPRAYDAVVINSVLQYFPGIEYALRVLEGAVRAVAPGGFVFVGDVRSLPLLDAFHAAVELERTSGRVRADELGRRAARRVSQEKELLLAPDFFAALRDHLPAIRDVKLQLKRGRRANEFTRFRFDATIEVGPAPDPPAVGAPLDWRDDGLDLGELRRRLGEQEPELLALTGVPNARLAGEVAVARRLATGDGATAGELRQARAGAAADAVDPEAVWRLADELPYAVDLRWPAGAAVDRFDVLLQRHDGGARESVDARLPQHRHRARPWTAYANNPLQGLFSQRLVPELRSWLAERLPEHMLPAAFMLVDALPKTASGKVDRVALASTDTGRPDVERAYVAPRSAAERVIAGLWEGVLGIDGVGVHDDFFAELGGHSLLATQVVARVRDAFRVELPLGRLFEAPTVAGLVEALAADPRAGARIERTAELLLEVAELPEEDVESMLAARRKR
jgi:SAM-dependent methyltransferase/acyl carrier protein